MRVIIKDVHPLHEDLQGLAGLNIEEPCMISVTVGGIRIAVGDITGIRFVKDGIEFDTMEWNPAMAPKKENA